MVSPGKNRYTTGKMMNALSEANSAYVPRPILANMGPVAMTTIKLKIQFEAVDRALAGARILSGVTSAGYSL